MYLPILPIFLLGAPFACAKHGGTHSSSKYSYQLHHESGCASDPGCDLSEFVTFPYRWETFVCLPAAPESFVSKAIAKGPIQVP